MITLKAREEKYAIVTKSSDNWSTERSGDLNKLNQFCIFPTKNKYGFPEVKSSEFSVEGLIPFHMCKNRRKSDQNKGVHFFLDDYKFEQVWTDPRKYINLFKFYNNIVSPTFSIYEVQPFALNVYNMYRSRWITRFYQECGVNVLVDIRWGAEDSFDYSFSGIEKHSPVIVNTVGTRIKDNRKLFMLGFKEAMKRIEPSKLYVYGEHLPIKFEDFVKKVEYFPSFWGERRDKIKSES